jgi:hypothetical protein
MNKFLLALFLLAPTFSNAQIASEANIPITLDTDNDSTPNILDTDDDNDGVLDNVDVFPLDNTKSTATTATSVATVIADASLRNNGSNGGKNYGAEPTSELNNIQRYQLLKFTKPAISGIISATLNVQTSTQANPLQISKQADNTWIEGTLNGGNSNGTTQGVTYTGNNTNYLAKTLLGTTTAPSAGKYTFALPLSSLPTSGDFSLIVQDLTNTGIATIYTKETPGKAATVDFVYQTLITPRLVVTPISNDTTYISGTPYTVGFALTQMPTDTVYIPIEIDASSKATIVGDKVLMFTPSNWNVMQTKTITPTSPGVFDVVIKPMHSDDAFYNGFNNNDVKNYYNQASNITNLMPWTVASGSTFTDTLDVVNALGDSANKFKLITAPVGMNVVENSGKLNFHPLSAQVGTWPITIEVKDSLGNLSYYNTSITVTNSGVPDPAGIYVVPYAAVNGTGTAASPFNNIPLALDAAALAGGGNVYVRGGVYELLDIQNITTVGPAANPIVIQPAPGENVKFDFGVKSNAFEFNASSRFIEFTGFEIDGGTDNVDFWCLPAQAFWGDQSVFRGGGIAIGVNGENITIRNNYIHNCFQKAVEIRTARYLKVYDNIIHSIATTSLSGGHGIMRQQASGPITTPDTGNTFRWDIKGNLIFNVEQRIYSWVPSKEFIDMVLDEGKPILIDDVSDPAAIVATMKANIENNVVAYGSIDQIRLKSTPNLTCKNNTVYSASPLADGITDKVGDTPTPKFSNAKIQNNAVQTMPGTFAFEMGDILGQGAATVPSTITGNYAAVGNVSPNGTAGITKTTNSLFVDPNNGNFRLQPTLGLPATLGVPAAVLDSIDARVAKYGVKVKWDEWDYNHLKLSQTILDNNPGVNDGIVGNETVLTNDGVLHLNPLPARSEIDFNMVIPSAWRTNICQCPTKSVEVFELNEEYAAWYKARNAATKNSSGQDYYRIRWGNSVLKQDQLFRSDVLTNSQITSATESTIIESDNSDFTLDGDLLVDFEGYTPVPGDSWLLMKAVTITSANTNGTLFDSVKFEGATLLPNQYTLSVINIEGGQALELKIISQVPATPIATLTQATCTNATGTINITSPLASGLTYSLDNIDYTNTTGIFTNVAPGTYSLTAKNATGGVSPSSVVTINPAPIVPTTPVVTLTQATCTTPTGSVAITNPTGSGYTYSKDGIAFTNTNGIFNSLNAGTYTLTVKSANGCTATSTAIINAAPSTPPTPIAITTQPTCNIAIGEITITSPNGSGIVYSMDGNTYTNTTGVFTNVASGTYSLTAQNASGCTSPQTVVIINAAPVIPAAPSVTPLSVTICNSVATSLSASGCTGDVTWYDASAPTISIGTGTSLSISPSATTTYFATCTNASSGCTSLPSNNATITVVMPPMGPSISVDNNNICVGTTITLSGLSCGAPDVLDWSLDGNPFGTGLSLTHMPPVGVHTFTAICNLTSAVGCASAASNIIVTVNALPNAPIINASSTTICAGTSATLIASGAMAGEDYVWSDGQTGSSITVSPSTTQIYTAKIINTTTNCESVSSAAQTISVTPIPSSAPIAAATPNAFCAGASTTLTASCILGNAVWYTDNTFSTIATTTVTPTSTTTYYVRCENMGCNGPAAAVTVTVNPKPITPVLNTIIANCTTPTGSITVTAPLTANMSYTIDGINYTNIDGIFNNLAIGTYTVYAKSDAGCISNGSPTAIYKLPCPDTLYYTPTCPTCPITACVTADDLPNGLLAANFSTCGDPDGYSSSSPDVNGCVTFTPVMALDTITDVTCIVAENDGIRDTTVIIIEPPLLSISGTVFNDVNGSTDNTLNGSGTNAGGLNAYAIDASGNAIAFGIVQPNGTYTITEVKRGLVSVLLSDAPPPPTQIGTPVPIAVSLPNGWVPTAEQVASVAGSDGNANAISSPLLLLASDTSGVNFAIEQAPVGQDTSLIAITNPGPGNGVVLDPNIFSGIDFVTNTIDSIFIQNYPSGADSIKIGSTVYTSANWPASGVSIETNTTGSPIQVIELFPEVATSFVDINFVFVDEANIKSINPINIFIPIIPAPLNINAIQLIGIKNVNSNLLSWSNTQSNEVVRYTLLRSESTNNGFVKIFETPSLITFEDKAFGVGTMYYQVEAKFKNGAIVKSNTIAIARDAKSGISIYPNPTRGALTVYFGAANKGDMQVSIYDMNGKEILRELVSNKQQTQLDLTNLANAEYLIKVTMQGAVGTFKVVKQ